MEETEIERKVRKIMQRKKKYEEGDKKHCQRRRKLQKCRKKKREPANCSNATWS